MEVKLTTDEAISHAISFLSQTLNKSKEDVVRLLLIEALTARKLMKPMEKS